MNQCWLVVSLTPNTRLLGAAERPVFGRATPARWRQTSSGPLIDDISQTIQNREPSPLFVRRFSENLWSLNLLVLCISRIESGVIRSSRTAGPRFATATGPLAHRRCRYGILLTLPFSRQGCFTARSTLFSLHPQGSWYGSLLYLFSTIPEVVRNASLIGGRFHSEGGLYDCVLGP
jgi:hypothetical protein